MARKMSEHQRETAFLRRCLRYGDSAEHEALDKKIAEIQRDERCVRRALWLLALLAALAITGLGYAAVFLEDFPGRMSRFATRFIVQLFCALSLGSLICIPAFLGLRIVYRMKLDQRREDCRRLVTKLLESRLGKPATTHWRESPVGRGNRETVEGAAGGNGSPNKTESGALD